MGNALWAPPPAYDKQKVGEPSQSTALKSVHEGHKPDALQRGWSFRIVSWNVDSMTGRAGELVKVFSRRKVDIGCVQETRWKGTGTRLFGEKGCRYKLFLQGCTMEMIQWACLLQRN